MSEGFSAPERFNPTTYFAQRVTAAFNNYRAEERKAPFPPGALRIAIELVRNDLERELSEVDGLSREEIDEWFGKDETVKKLVAIEQARESALDASDHVIVDKEGLVLGAATGENVRNRMREEGEARN